MIKFNEDKIWVKDWWTIPLLTRVYSPPNGCLKIVAAMVCDTLASCVRTLFIRGMIRWHNALWLGTQGTSPFVHVSKCWSEWSSKGLERKRSRVLDCLCAWAAWVCGAMALPHSFLLPFSLFLFSLFIFFFFYLSLSLFLFLFLSFFLNKLGLTPSWNKDTPLDV